LVPPITSGISQPAWPCQFDVVGRNSAFEIVSSASSTRKGLIRSPTKRSQLAFGTFDLSPSQLRELNVAASVAPF
jgi:hypothetical protein